MFLNWSHILQHIFTAKSSETTTKITVDLSFPTLSWIYNRFLQFCTVFTRYLREESPNSKCSSEGSIPIFVLLNCLATQLHHLRLGNHHPSLVANASAQQSFLGSSAQGSICVKTPITFVSSSSVEALWIICWLECMALLSLEDTTVTA